MMHRVLLLALSAALLALPARAQSTAPGASTSAESARWHAARPLPASLVPSSPAFEGVELDALAARRRPWWLLPAIGAGVGLLVGFAVDDDCAERDATFCFPAPLVGVVVGGAGGLLAEALLQSWVDDRAVGPSRD